MTIRFNAPVAIGLTVSALAALLINVSTGGYANQYLFSTYADGFSLLSFFRLFSHVLGHSGWDHFLANFTLILVLGPLLEEKYGSGRLLVMIMVTAMVTALLNNIFFSTGLLGASGIVFMMIVLSSFSNYRNGELPVTFLVVVCLFLGREIIASFQPDTVSQFAHIAGGVAGSVFGLSGLLGGRRGTPET
ncbi:MAG: rhomboid family intramembrane serine protease [Candidatus Kapabacteria bacterium]|nr:rhomboid family intramembrane serine protease [Candidatus Kapabacteria bacterium]